MKFEQLRNEFLKEAKARHRELQLKLSEYDTMLSDAMHFLELEKCDAIAMVKTAKIIKGVRQQRRDVKTEIDKLRSTISSMTEGVTKFDKKHYTYRTKIMNNVSNKSLKG